MEGISDIVAQAVESRREGKMYTYNQCVSELYALGYRPAKVDKLLQRYEAQLLSIAERHGCGGAIPNLHPAV